MPMGEQRNLEFKQSMSWTENATKTKLTRTILGMSNIRDGGFIVLGVRENPDGTFVIEGVTPEHDATLVYDDIIAWANSHADPYVKISLQRLVCDTKRLLIIKVEEFDDVPAFCKNQSGTELKQGALYVRSRRMAETVEINGSTEMREVLDMAFDKRLRRFSRSLDSLGITTNHQTPQTVTDSYNQELDNAFE